MASLNRTILSGEILSKTGRRYFYDALTNKFFGSNDPAKKTPLIQDQISPIQRIKLPFSSNELKQELKTRLSHLILNVTEQCNLRCDYCSYSGHQQFRRRHSPAQMSLDVARGALDWFFEHSREAPEITISFYGGEPLLNQEIIKDTVAYAKSLFHHKKIRFMITTNGLFLDTNFTSWLSVNPEVFINVTLNGPAEFHDRFRHTADGQGSQFHIMQNLNEIKHNDPAMFARRIGITINYLTAVELPVIQEWWFAEPIFQAKLPLALRRIILRFADDELKNRLQRFMPDQSAVQAAFNRLEAEYITHLKRRTPERNLWGLLWDSPLAHIHFRSRLPLEPIHLFTGSCVPFARRTFVDVNGNLRLCEKSDGKVIFGQVKEGIDFHKLAELVAGFGELLNQHCRFCYAIRYCTLCLNDVLDVQGISNRLQSSKCRDVKIGFQRELALYCSIMEEGEELLEHLYPPGNRFPLVLDYSSV
ncbi:MAG: radical SAM protein [Firmicutes bacterium]|nr:radical SAM protein [Bacillota bacterium]